MKIRTLAAHLVIRAVFVVIPFFITVSPVHADSGMAYEQALTRCKSAEASNSVVGNEFDMNALMRCMWQSGFEAGEFHAESFDDSEEIMRDAKAREMEMQKSIESWKASNEILACAIVQMSGGASEHKAMHACDKAEPAVSK